MRRGLAAAGLTGLAAAALATPPLTQNEQGRCVSRGVQDRFREPVPAGALAREIVDSCIPSHRSAREADPERRARFDELYAAERDGALRTSAMRIDRFRRNSASAAESPRSAPTLDVPTAERILRMASTNWPRPIRVSQTRLERPAGRRESLNGDWERLAVRRIVLEAGGKRFATYYVDSGQRVTALFVNSGPPPLCRRFGAGETLAVEAALMAVPAASAVEVQRVRASVRTGWNPPYARLPARLGPYVFLASRAGDRSGGCHDHLSLTLAPAS